MHRGRDAVYVEVGGRCVGVVTLAAVAVPCALRTTLPSLPAGPDATCAEVSDGVLHLDGAPLVIGRLVDVGVPRLRTEVTSGAPAPGDVAAMVGRGEGLTPYADDVLSGWLAVHRAAGVATPEVDAAVRANLHRTTLLSATLLDCAMAGEAVPELAAWLTAPGDAGLAERLLAVGHSSGRGLLEGATRALVHLCPGVVAGVAA